MLERPESLVSLDERVYSVPPTVQDCHVEDEVECGEGEKENEPRSALRPSARTQRETIRAMTNQVHAMRRKHKEECKIIRKKIRKQRKRNSLLGRQVQEAVWALGLEPANSCRRIAHGRWRRAPHARSAAQSTHRRRRRR